jgi:hypothetical protein
MGSRKGWADLYPERKLEAGGVSQVVERLPSTHEVLSSSQKGN